MPSQGSLLTREFSPDYFVCTRRVQNHASAKVSDLELGCSPWQDITRDKPKVTDKTQAGHNLRVFHSRLVFAVSKIGANEIKQVKQVKNKVTW